MPISLLLLLVDTLQTTLENRVASFEEWLKLWTAIVVLGLLYEYECELLEPPRNWPPKRSWPFRHSVQLVKLGAIFVTVGVAGELYVEVMSSPAQEALRKFNDTRLAELNKEAGDARKEAGLAIERASKADERASKNEKEAATLRKRAEDEVMARVKIEARVAWRRLTAQQKADIGSALGRFSGQTVSFWYSNGDTECSWFAADIAEAAVAAKTLRVHPPGGVETMMESGRFGAPVRRTGTGVRVQSTGDDRSRQFANAIIHELTIRGFDAARQTDPAFDPNPIPQVWVNVDPRPDGPQGEFKLAAQKSASGPKK
jgi:hypothetical protein